MPEIPQSVMMLSDDAIIWAAKLLQAKEQSKKEKLTPKAKTIVEKKAALGSLALLDDAAVWGSKLVHRMNPLKNLSSQNKPTTLQPNLKQAEYALGIPSKVIKDLPRISEPQPMRIAIQAHKAKRAGQHYDVRIVDDKTGKAYSWAAKNLPIHPGDKTLAVLQPTHTAAYSTWEGKIESGYGAGDVRVFSQDRIEVIKAEPTKITFNVYKTNGDTERYAMINTGGDQWLFHNVTPTRVTRPEIPTEKPHYKNISPDVLDPTKPNEIWAPKIDGALNVFFLRPDKPIETYSYRPSAKGTNKLIDHTFRLGLHRTIVPTAFRGKTVLLGEVYAKERATGKVLPSTDTTARLLSNVWRSRELQQNAPLDNVVFNVLRYHGYDVSKKPYSEKLRILKEITSAVPQLKMPPLYTTSESKAELMKEIKSGTHPLTGEGVVVYKLNEDTPIKSKLQQDYDVYIRGTFPGEGKYKGKAAGGFTYSFKPTGPITGRVGSGLSDTMRKELWEQPERYKGSVARIFAQQQLPSGALRMPVFKDIRSEKFASWIGLGKQLIKKLPKLNTRTIESADNIAIGAKRMKILHPILKRVPPERSAQYAPHSKIIMIPKKAPNPLWSAFHEAGHAMENVKRGPETSSGELLTQEHKANRNAHKLLSQFGATKQEHDQYSKALTKGLRSYKLNYLLKKIGDIDQNIKRKTYDAIFSGVSELHDLDLLLKHTNPNYTKMKQLYSKANARGLQKRAAINTILHHGSPIQNLKILAAEYGRFGKTFATPSMRRAVRYMGDGYGTTRDLSTLRGILGSTPEKLITTKGSVYDVARKDFNIDFHKGPHTWVYSTTDPVKPLTEKKFDSVLKAWTDYGLVAIPKKIKAEHVTKEMLEDLFETQKELLKKGSIPAQEPVTGYPISSTSLHEIGKTQGEDTFPDSNVAARQENPYVMHIRATRRFLKKKAESSASAPQTTGGSELYMSETPKTNNYYQDTSAYRITEHTPDAPSSTTVVSSPTKNVDGRRVKVPIKPGA